MSRGCRNTFVVCNSRTLAYAHTPTGAACRCCVTCNGRPYQHGTAPEHPDLRLLVLRSYSRGFSAQRADSIHRATPLPLRQHEDRIDLGLDQPSPHCAAMREKAAIASTSPCIGLGLAANPIEQGSCPELVHHGQRSLLGKPPAAGNRRIVVSLKSPAVTPPVPSMDGRPRASRTWRGSVRFRRTALRCNEGQHAKLSRVAASGACELR